MDAAGGALWVRLGDLLDGSDDFSLLLERAVSALDQGASGVILPAAAMIGNDDDIRVMLHDRGVPLDRVRLNVNDNDDIGAVEVYKSLLLGDGQDDDWVFARGQVAADWTADNCADGKFCGRQPVLDARLVLQKQVDLGHVLAAMVRSDRPDGLIPTVVVNEQRQSLGLVYSSAESISEAVRTGRGVYYSRSRRGLWVKGETSGAIQELIGIAVDCDADALQFTVRQFGSGFCHLDRASCFGTSLGLEDLMRTLEDRRERPLAGSYTNKLFEDSTLLHSKVRILFSILIS